MKILFGILDWGLGHATRSIPLIHDLLQFQCQIFIAASGPQQKILRESFPGVHFLEPPPYAIHYPSAAGSMQIAILKQLPRLASVIRAEQRWVRQVQAEHEFNLIISDNRYGFYHSSVHSIFITHQLSPRSGWGNLADSILRSLHYRFIRPFNECWVPDFEAEGGLAGDLSHPKVLPANTHYIGALSRFHPATANGLEHLLILISGPEPARTEFETLMRQQLKYYQGKWILVRGLPGLNETDAPNTLNHAGTEQLAALISNASLVICRSGYSSVMDLARMGKKALMVPTPGQTEQEYLAGYLSSKGIFPSMQQKGFNLAAALEQSAHYPFKTWEADFDAHKTELKKRFNR